MLICDGGAKRAPRLRKVCTMRCIACGTEMRFVRAVPDQSMVSSRELHVFECQNCQRTEQRLALTHNIEPLPSEPMQLPSVSSPALTAAAHKASAAARSAWMRAAPTVRGGLSSVSALLTSAQHKVSAAQHKVSAAAQSAWVRTTTQFRGSLPLASSALLTSAQHKVSVAQRKVSVAARSAWARTAAMFRGRPDAGS
jgi:hypothetical protein